MWVAKLKYQKGRVYNEYFLQEKKCEGIVVFRLTIHALSRYPSLGLIVVVKGSCPMFERISPKVLATIVTRSLKGRNKTESGDLG
jgi:hypothetical protein